MKQELKVITHGEPTTDNLTEREKIAFFTTLLLRMQQLVSSGK